jgi:L-malate glycosyltransferase
MVVSTEIQDLAGSPSPVRIVYLIDWIHQGGGTENHLRNLIHRSDRSRFHSTLFSLKPKNPSFYAEVDCPTHFLDVKRLLSVRSFVALWKFVWFLRRNHTNILQTYFQDSNLFGVIAGRLARVPVIVVNRRDMGLWHSPRSLRSFRIVNRLASYCIANAKAVKNLVARTEPFPQDRIRVIYNGVAPSPPKSEPALTRKELGLPDEVPVVGIVANLRQVKRIDLFLKVAAALPQSQVYFLIVGWGGLKSELTLQAEQLGIGSRTVFYQTDGRVPEVMALMNVGVLTSAWRDCRPWRLMSAGTVKLLPMG